LALQQVGLAGGVVGQLLGLYEASLAPPFRIRIKAAAAMQQLGAALAAERGARPLQ
jgi:hypothetical protein